MDFRGPWRWFTDARKGYCYSEEPVLVDAAGEYVLSASGEGVAQNVDVSSDEYARLIAAAPELLAMLKRMATPEVSRCEVNRSMVDVDRECGEKNRCEPCRAALEAEALIARVEGGR